MDSAVAYFQDVFNHLSLTIFNRSSLCRVLVIFLGLSYLYLKITER